VIFRIIGANAPAGPIVSTTSCHPWPSRMQGRNGTNREPAGIAAKVEMKVGAWMAWVDFSQQPQSACWPANPDALRRLGLGRGPRIASPERNYSCQTNSPHRHSYTRCCRPFRVSRRERIRRGSAAHLGQNTCLSSRLSLPRGLFSSMRPT